MQDTLGLEDEGVLRASAAMSGGIGGQHDACGGLLGAAMVFGTLYGRDRDSLDDKEKMGELMPRVGKLYKWYEKTFGSATCYDIKTLFGDGVFYDMFVPWQAELAVEAGIPGRCVDLVEETVAYMMDALYDDVKKK
ncbi:MAG: C-GCAxxG-C-C family protein [Dehalococcoidales bacterium]|nr:C-GCAxxG-C-C family protein [Dehalococcoidales bacterium]